MTTDDTTRSEPTLLQPSPSPTRRGRALSEVHWVKKRARILLAALFFALMFSYGVAGTYLNFTRVSLLIPLARGWDVMPRDGRVFVSHVFEGGQATSLCVGDEVIALDGEPVESLAKMDKLLEQVRPTDTYAITVARNGREVSLTLESPPTPPYVWALISVFALTTFMFLSAGLALFLLKPFDKQALILALFFGTTVLIPFVPANPSWWLMALTVTGSVIGAFVAPLSLQFTLNFPERLPLLGRFPRLEWYIYLPCLLFLAPFTGISVFLIQKAPEQLFASPFPVLYNISTALRLLYLLGGVSSFIFGYRHLNLLGRRKVRVLLVATLVATVPLIAASTFALMNGGTFIPQSSPANKLSLSPTQLGWSSVARFGTLWGMPLAWAYAILRHQVIPVSLMIRRGVQYLLAKNALRLLIALPILSVTFKILSNPNRTLAELLFTLTQFCNLLVIVTAMLGLVFRKRLSVAIDRRFFRESYNQETILRGLIDEVKKADSISAMSKLVSEKVDSALHPRHVYLFYREQERSDLSLGYSSARSDQELRIPEEFLLLRFMEDRGGALDYPLQTKYDLPQSEKDWLAQLGTSLIVPMAGTDGRLEGLLLVGEKRSEIPYTARDRELLETLANQIAIVYENVRLKERVDRDRRIKHEVLARIDERQFNLLKECPRCGACYDSSAGVCEKDQRALILTLPVERTIENRYRLDQLIGKGGMGAVYEAEDLRLNRRAAVKILTGRLFGDSAALRRFEREARSLARLSHPNIVTIHDYGVLGTEGAFLVMELARGETLGSRLKRESFVPSEVAAELFDQVLEGVNAAHSAGIVHRDLKPENIFITADGRVKILDFGLAKLRSQTSEAVGPGMASQRAITDPSVVMGTIGYMSPEQLTGLDVDERSDLFSIGVMIVEALTGQCPFTGANHRELLMNILQEPFHLNHASPRAKRLDAVLQRCLAKDRSDRFPSASQMQSEMIPAIGGCPQLTLRKVEGLDGATVILGR